MTRHADRLSRAAAALLAAVNLLFLLGFIAALLFATSRAGAEESCSGKDLVGAMATAEPAKLAAIRAEAAKTENGEGLLWRVEKAGIAPSHLFGTMHMSDPRVVDLPPPAEKAFGDAAVLIIETTDVLDPSKLTEIMATHPQLMMFTEGGSLPAMLTRGQREAVDAGLKSRGMSLAALQKMKPWIVAALVSLPACELQRQAEGAPVLDVLLAQRAKERGIPVRGLEAAVDQLEAMAALPMAFHLQGLVDTLALGRGIDDVMESMIVLYKAGEIAAVWPFFEATLPAANGDEAGYAAFQETMIVSRNRTMAREAAAELAKGGAFIAVGALHLPGAEGLVELLRRDGYTVTRADL